jgi:hypothetical protein
MACFEYGTIIDLAPRETVTLPDIRGATLRVTRGTVWITQENDPQDVVLRTGDTWTVERDGLTVLEAQSDTSFCILGRRVEARVMPGPTGAGTAAHFWSRTRGALSNLVFSRMRGAVPYY